MSDPSGFLFDNKQGQHLTFEKKEEEINTSVSQHSFQDQNAVLLNRSNNLIPLEQDKEIQPLAAQNQVKARRPFNKARFVEHIKKLNKASQGLDPDKNAEKGYLVKDLYRMKAMRIVEGKDQDGKLITRSLPSDIKKVLSTLDAYVSNVSTARQNAYQRGWNIFTIAWWAFRVWNNSGGSRSEIKKEHETIAKLKRQLAEVIPRYKNQPAYQKITGELTHVYNKIVTTCGTVQGTFANREERMAAKWKGFNPAHSITIDGTGKKLQTTVDSDKTMERFVLGANVFRDRKSQPLFAHRPCIEDICQGSAGNCFFLAALAAIQGNKIRDMMLDNEDGTVTVRFYEKVRETGKRRPVYVTVDKNVKVNSSLDCLWVQVMEKAYALFRQSQAQNRLSFLKKTEKDPQTNEVKTAKAQVIPEDTIDLGFLANGGYSNEVLGDLLGTEDEKIEIETLRRKRKPSSLCMDLLRCTEEKGRAYTKIDRLREDLAEKEKEVENGLEERGMTRADYMLLSRDIETLKADITGLEADISTKEQDLQKSRTALDNFKKEAEKDKDNLALQARLQMLEYQYSMEEAGLKGDKTRLELSRKELAGKEQIYAPFKAALNDLRDSRLKIEAQQRELAKEHGLTDPTNLKEHEGAVGIDKYGRNVVETAPEELIGMEKECETAKEAIRKKFAEMNLPDAQQQNDMLCAVAALAKYPKLFIDEALIRDNTTKTRNAEEYADLLGNLINSVKNKETFFKEVVLQGGLRGYLNNEDALAEDIMAKFLLPVFTRMLKNIGKLDDFAENTEMGEEDPISVGYFNRIAEMLKNKQSVCCGTRTIKNNGDQSFSGEHTDQGRVGSHAYTILAATRTEDGVRVLKLRNTHAAYTAKYKLNKRGGLEAEASKTDTNGVFWIELNHFMKYVNNIYGSGTPNLE